MSYTLECLIPAFLQRSGMAYPQTCKLWMVTLNGQQQRTTKDLCWLQAVLTNKVKSANHPIPLWYISQPPEPPFSVTGFQEGLASQKREAGQQIAV
jgi:hypothetical protein